MQSFFGPGAQQPTQQASMLTPPMGGDSSSLTVPTTNTAPYVAQMLQDAVVAASNVLLQAMQNTGVPIDTVLAAADDQVEQQKVFDQLGYETGTVVNQIADAYRLLKAAHRIVDDSTGSGEQQVEQQVEEQEGKEDLLCDRLSALEAQLQQLRALSMATAAVQKRSPTDPKLAQQLADANNEIAQVRQEMRLLRREARDANVFC